MAAATLGTQFTCFTGAKVQILTLIRRAPNLGMAAATRAGFHRKRAISSLSAAGFALAALRVSVFVLMY